jgi:hypothetical protein
MRNCPFFARSARHILVEEGTRSSTTLPIISQYSSPTSLRTSLLPNSRNIHRHLPSSTLAYFPRHRPLSSPHASLRHLPEIVPLRLERQPDDHEIPPFPDFRDNPPPLLWTRPARGMLKHVPGSIPASVRQVPVDNSRRFPTLPNAKPSLPRARPMRNMDKRQQLHCFLSAHFAELSWKACHGRTQQT